MHRQELRKAINLAGSQAKLAKKLGITRAAVNNWLNGEIEVPVKKALLIEAIFNGAVLAEKLSPQDSVEIMRFKEYWKKKVITDA